jgi:hypothetical protein
MRDRKAPAQRQAGSVLSVLAAMLVQPGLRREYDRDPARFLETYDLADADRQMILGIAPRQLTRHAKEIVRKREALLEFALPTSTGLLARLYPGDDSVLRRYITAVPPVERESADRQSREVERFRDHLVGTDGLVIRPARDVAIFESERYLLRQDAEATVSARAAGELAIGFDECVAKGCRLRFGRHVRLVTVAHDPTLVTDAVSGAEGTPEELRRAAHVGGGGHYLVAKRPTGSVSAYRVDDRVCAVLRRLDEPSPGRQEELLTSPLERRILQRAFESRILAVEAG